MKYIGIDGGGTKTRFCLADESLNILSEHQTTGCYYPHIGKNGIINVIREGIKMCLQSAGINNQDITVCCGLPAYGELDSLMADLPDMQRRIGSPVLFCNDAEVCHAGALNLEAGITVIAGTGSIAFGRDESGGSARSGGFGSEMNCDEGSAHYIGLRLIQKFTRQADFREERTLLYNAVKNALGLKNDIDIYAYMVEEIKMNRETVAGLAVLAYNTALQGDPICKNIFSDAAHELYLLAAAVKKQLDFKDLPVKVSYAGGVFKSGELILSELGSLLRDDNMMLIAPQFPPAMGACILAKKQEEQ